MCVVDAQIPGESIGILCGVLGYGHVDRREKRVVARAYYYSELVDGIAWSRMNDVSGLSHVIFLSALSRLNDEREEKKKALQCLGGDLVLILSSFEGIEAPGGDP